MLIGNGFVRWVMHKSGVLRDHCPTLGEDRKRVALEDLARLEPPQPELVKQVAGADERETVTFEQAESTAAAKLVSRPGRASVARERLDERNEQTIAHQPQRERILGRNHGMELAGPGEGWKTSQRAPGQA